MVLPLPTTPDDDGTLAPNYVLTSESIEVDAGVRDLIESVEYESSDGLADILRIRAVNKDFALSDSKVFAPGNEVSVFMGYGSNLKHIGRVKIFKNKPTFPESGWPMFEAVGYTRDHEMMFKQPEASSRGSAPGGKTKQKGGRRFRDVKYSDAVLERAEDYGFIPDIDTTPEEPTNFIQKAGMTDYDFIKGLSNLTGYLFWVDGDENGRWTLHFKDPESFNEQDRTFTFEYNLGDLSTLYTFEPELLVSGAIARIRARVKDPRTGRVIESEFSEDNTDSPEVTLEPGTDRLLDQIIQEEPQTSTSVQIFIGDYSFEDVANRRFRSEAELVRWVRQWYRRQRENFILCRGVTTGVEDIMSRQVHAINGVGTMYSGRYYFSKVKHTMDSNGYTLHFGARKQTPAVT